MKMRNKRKTISELRKEQYAHNSAFAPYINDWRKNPYTWFKARFYMEASAILVFFLLKAKIRPNTVTIVYGIAGIVGGILLSIPNNYTIVVAVFIFFTKGILDWSDGHLARNTGQTSLTGAILDEYGALLNSLGLQIGLGFYVTQKNGIDEFYYLIPIIPFLYAVKLSNFSRAFILESCITAEKISKKIISIHSTLLIDKSSVHTDKQTIRIKFIYNIINNFLDARARSVDFICLLIIIEIFSQFSITWLIFLLLLIKEFLIFLGAFYSVVRKGWAEKKEYETMMVIYQSSRNLKP